jgi:hypothetical protein
VPVGGAGATFEQGTGRQDAARSTLLNARLEGLVQVALAPHIG